MSLLPPSQLTNASIALSAQQCANHISSAAVLAGQMTQAALSLDDEVLTAWLNSRPPQETQHLFAAHEALGVSINSAADVAAAALASSGIPANIQRVDVRPVAEKLADQRRVLEFDGGKFIVTTLPPEEVEEIETGVGEGDMPEID
jgi:hypothetical protein